MAIYTAYIVVYSMLCFGYGSTLLFLVKNIFIKISSSRNKFIMKSLVVIIMKNEK